MALDTVVLGLACTLLGAAFGWAGYKRNAAKDARDKGRTDGVILTELGYVKSGIDDIKRKQAEQDEKHVALLSRVIAVEASARQAHKRIDDIVCRDKIKEEWSGEV